MSASLADRLETMAIGLREYAPGFNSELLMQAAAALRAYENALQRVDEAVDGIYPASIQVGDGPVKPRTEWQNGWNECVMQVTKAIGSAYNILPEPPAPPDHE